MKSLFWRAGFGEARKGTSISLIVVTVLFLAVFTGSGAAQIYSLTEMNTESIRKLDHDKTVVLIPGGIMEEHGPYLPSFTDGIADQAFTQELARAIVERPGWKVLVFPQIPLGNGGANNFGGVGKRVFPGSYTVSMRTLRSVYMDLGDEFGGQGFRWIFLVHNHGDPNHNRALDQASDYFHDTYGGTMVHLFGLKPMMECCGSEERFFNANERAEEGLTVHAGADEHSQMLFLRSDLVADGYLQAPSLPGKTFDDLYRIAATAGWPGYFGAPRLANSAMGGQEFKLQSQKLIETTQQILDGLDWQKIPRFADDVDPRDAVGEREGLRYEQKQEERHNAWLKSKHGMDGQ